MTQKPSTDLIRKVGYNILSNKKETKNFNLSQDNIVEWIRCRKNPLYYIYNYVSFETIGGGLDNYKNKTNFHLKLKRFIRASYRYHKATLMASRQLGKSTCAAALISWCMTFYPRIQPIILNFQKAAALGNLQKIKFINENLPDFLRLEATSKSDIKTYYELSNGSIVNVFYPSTVHSKSTLARSLTSSVLYIDEGAFINSMYEVFGSSQQVLSKAREQAILRNIPYMIMITSTPNGVAGDGQWFHDRWMKGIDSDILFDENDDWVENADEYVNDPTKNGFINILFHWSEDPNKTQEWYLEQCRELSDQRKINQELDLIFVGSSNCIFDDELLGKFQFTQPIKTLSCPHQTNLLIFDEIDTKDYYLIGVDTARSISGAYNSIEIFSFLEFKQIAEFNYRLGSFTKYGEIIDFIFRWLHSIVGDNIIIVIENNTIGLAPIEYLINHVSDIDYSRYLYKDKSKKATEQQYGVETTGVSKDLMIGCLTEILKNDPTVVKSQALINQISGIERTRSGNIGSNTFSDLFMASSFCAYARKMKSMDILPIIKLGKETIQQQVYENLKAFVTTNVGLYKEENNQDITEFEIDNLIEFELERRNPQNKNGNIDEFFSPFF